MISHMKYEEWEQVTDKQLKKGYWGYLFILFLLFGGFLSLLTSMLLGHNFDIYILAALFILLIVWEFRVGQRVKKRIRKQFSQKIIPQTLLEKTQNTFPLF